MKIELIKADFVHKVSDSRSFLQSHWNQEWQEREGWVAYDSRACEGTDIIEDTFISNSRIGTVEFESMHLSR